MGKKMQDKRIVVFDFDGTLVNSMGRLTEIAARVMSDHFHISKEEGRRLYQLTSGLPFSEQLATLYPEQADKNDRAAQVFEVQKKRCYFEEPIYPDTDETIRYLKDKGYRVIISSNSAQDLVERLVAKHQIPCDLVLGYKENFSKGLPHFLYILNRWKGSPHDLVFIGDSIKDGERAFESGIDFIAKEGIFTREQFQTRFPGIAVVSALSELKEIF